MSYLEMNTAPIPNMTSGIISLWFRDARKNDPPPPEPWPSGEWALDTTSMVPPDVFKLAAQQGFKQNIFYWNSYGLYSEGSALPILGPAAVMMPSPPPFITNDMHMMLTFGNPGQSYDYYSWKLGYPAVLDAVIYVPMLVSGPQWSVPSWPPPYAPWFVKLGKFKVTTLELSGLVPKSNYVPQSFIGVDKDGYLTICLQTETKAEYKGYAFQLDKVTEIWATATYLDKPSLSEGGKWVKVPGYWDGYEFRYTDISDKVMGAQTETFVIGGPPGVVDFVTVPPVTDGAWHHLLFSFDIAGTVELKLPSLVAGARPPPVVSTGCKAWLALDDKNYTGTALQHRFPMHDGIQLPLLPGMGTDVVGFGPVTSATRANIGLTGGNDILPRNCWIIPFRGNPKDGLRRFSSTAGLWEADSTFYINKGDYNWFAWTGSIWTLYGNPGSTDWRGALDPPRPSTPDPKTFDVPTYNGGPYSIPVAGFPIGIPASAQHLDHNTGIEMGELQIWANATLDTGNVARRRLFIDSKGRPVSPSKAEQVLGKPDIKLHGTSNWKNGKNTGKSGVDSEGKTIRAGQFDPMAQIKKFLPDPALGK